MNWERNFFSPFCFIFFHKHRPRCTRNVWMNEWNILITLIFNITVNILLIVTISFYFLPFLMLCLMRQILFFWSKSSRKKQVCNKSFVIIIFFCCCQSNNRILMFVTTNAQTQRKFGSWNKRAQWKAKATRFYFLSMLLLLLLKDPKIIFMLDYS